MSEDRDREGYSKSKLIQIVVIVLLLLVFTLITFWLVRFLLELHRPRSHQFVECSASWSPSSDWRKAGSARVDVIDGRVSLGDPESDIEITSSHSLVVVLGGSAGPGDALIQFGSTEEDGVRLRNTGRIGVLVAFPDAVTAGDTCYRELAPSGAVYTGGHLGVPSNVTVYVLE